MPSLPTITVTDTQQTRILEAYKALYGTTTTADTIAAYKRWLATTVRDVVLAYEGQKIDVSNFAARASAMNALIAALPDPDSVT